MMMGRMLKISAFGASVLGALVFMPTIGELEMSLIGRISAMPNAGCFSTISTNYPIIGWIGPICADWKHCEKDDQQNLAKGYSCARKETP